MATELVPVVATTEKALRARIHVCSVATFPTRRNRVCRRISGLDPPRTKRTRRSWTFTTGIELSDEISVQSEGSPEERQWLNSPHVDLDGMFPEAMLTGDIHSRRRLGAFVAAIETAVRQGSFS